MKDLDPRTLRAVGRVLRKHGRHWQTEHAYNYGLGFIDAGNHCSQQARAIEKRRTKKAGKRG